jgi:transcriptional regulator with XRE-family HTH domain
MTESPIDRIKSIMARRGLSQGDLATLVDTTQPTVSQFLNAQSPRKRTVDKYAKALGVDPEWLWTGEWKNEWEQTYEKQRPKDPPSQKPALWPKTKTPIPDTTRPEYDHNDPNQAPLVGTVSAGDGSISYIEHPRAFRRRNRPLMRVVGDSAFPVAYDGQFVEVDLDTPPRHNNLVIVETAETDAKGIVHHRSYLKRYCVDPRAPHGFVLASVNAGIDSPYIPLEQILAMRRVVGVVFEE